MNIHIVFPNKFGSAPRGRAPTIDTCGSSTSYVTLQSFPRCLYVVHSMKKSYSSKLFAY